MWILSWGDKTIPLLGNAPVTVGRDEAADIRIDSVSVSRHQLELLPDGDDIKVMLLSRAKSLINDVPMKLSKGESPREVLFQTPVTIGFKDEGPPICLTKRELKVFGNTAALKGHIPFSHAAIENADICVASESPDLALALGKGVVGQKWVDFVVQNPTAIDQWWFNVDHVQFGGIAPNQRRTSLLHGVTVVIYDSTVRPVFVALGAMEVITVAAADDVAAIIGTKNSPMVVIGRKIGNYPSTSMEEVSLAILTVDSSHFHCFTPDGVHKSPPAMVNRKRKRYERNPNKMAYFDIKIEPGESMQPEPIVYAASTVPESPVDTACTLPSDLPPASEGNVTNEAHTSTEPNQASVTEIPVPMADAISGEAGYTTSSAGSGDEITAKVSLYDAIKKVKQHASESIGFEDTTMEPDDTTCATVAVVPMSLRNRPSSTTTTGSFNPKYNGRLNTKIFRKTQRLTAVVSKRYIDVAVTQDQSSFDDVVDGLAHAAEVEEQLQVTFDGLFVPEDDDNDDGPPPPAFFRNTVQSTTNRRAISRGASAPDSESEDDGPRFGFSRC